MAVYKEKSFCFMLAIFILLVKFIPLAVAEDECSYFRTILISLGYNPKFSGEMGCCKDSFVSCSDDKIVELEIDTFQIKKKKELPSEIGKLKHLKKIIIKNLLEGGIPDSIGDLSNLEYLDLSNNDLDSIPCSINKLVKLKTFYLDKNPDLEGFIPALPKLTDISSIDTPGVCYSKNITSVSSEKHCKMDVDNIDCEKYKKEIEYDSVRRSGEMDSFLGIAFIFTLIGGCVFCACCCCSSSNSNKKGPPKGEPELGYDDYVKYVNKFGDDKNDKELTDAEALLLALLLLAKKNKNNEDSNDDDDDDDEDDSNNNNNNNNNSNNNNKSKNNNNDYSSDNKDNDIQPSQLNSVNVLPNNDNISLLNHQYPPISSEQQQQFAIPTSPLPQVSLTPMAVPMGVPMQPMGVSGQVVNPMPPMGVPVQVVNPMQPMDVPGQVVNPMPPMGVPGQVVNPMPPMGVPGQAVNSMPLMNAPIMVPSAPASAPTSPMNSNATLPVDHPYASYINVDKNNQNA